MKKLVPVLALGLVLTACGEEGREAASKVDNALEKVEEKAEVLADSAKEKYKDVRDHLDTVFDRDHDDTAL